MERVCQLLLIVAAIAGLATGASVPVHMTQETMGVVSNLTRCGGFGTPLELRISDCNGKCEFMPGTRYDLEYDIMPSSASPSLSIACDLVFNGSPLRLFEAEIANSSVQPGFIYTVKFTIVPNDVLSGQTVKLRGIIYHTDNRLLEICMETDVDILNLP